MIKLLKILEIKNFPSSHPKGNLEKFILDHLKEIREKVEDFDHYVDINKPYTLESYTKDFGDDADYLPKDYLILANDPALEDCLCIGFTADTKNMLEGDGPIDNGHIVKIAGYEIQYQLMAC